MRIGILSDTHDQSERVARAIGILVDKEVRYLFHCGDVTNPAVIEACSPIETYFVFGNNDRDLPALKRAIAKIGGHPLGFAGEVKLGGKRIALTHGHLKRELTRLLARSPDYLLVGHSHRLVDRNDGNTRIINPGALYRAPGWTFALLDLGEDRLERFDLKALPR